MRPHLVTASILWVLLTAIGEALVFTDLFPAAGSAESKDFDFIFRFLLIFGIPVFTFVIATLAYSIIRFSRPGKPTEDGPAMHGTGLFPKAWLAVTGGLTLLIMVYPGLTGLAELQRDARGYGWGGETPEMVIRVTGQQWYWQIEYPDANVTIVGQDKEMVLPVDTAIRFEATAKDVIHSLWIPAFRMRIDALPGRTTYMVVKPTQLGEYAQDEAYRFQCSQLCGLDHAKMRMIVKVVSKDDFQAWLASQQKPGQ